MAIITFGVTFRAANAGFGLQNSTAQNVAVPAFGLNIPGNSTKFVHLDVYDEYVRNPRHVQVYDVLTSGKVYRDDWVDLCKLIQNGTLIVRTTSYSASANTFTALLTASTSTALISGGSSVWFS